MALVPPAPLLLLAPAPELEVVSPPTRLVCNITCVPGLLLARMAHPNNGYDHG